MKNTVITIVTMISFTICTGAAWAYDLQEEPCNTPACVTQGELNELLAEQQSYEDQGISVPDWITNAISETLGLLLKIIATDRPMLLPFNAYPVGDELLYLRMILDVQFGPELSEMITDATLVGVWASVENEFEDEFYAAHNGVSSVSEMSYYLKDTGLLVRTVQPRWLAKSKMNGYNLSSTYLPSSYVVPTTPAMPVSPDYQESFDSQSAFIMSWPRFRPTTWKDTTRFVKKLVQAGQQVNIIVEDEIWHRAALYFLENAAFVGLSMSDIEQSVRFMYLDSDWVDARTFSPYFVNTVSDGMLAVCPQAGVPWAPIVDDQENCVLIANYLGIPVLEMYYQNNTGETVKLHLEGGNFLSDGNGTAFVSNAVFNPIFNSELTEVELEMVLYDYLGITDVVVVPLGESTSAGHISDWVMMVDEFTVIVSEGTLYMVDELNTVAQIISDAGYVVERVPLPVRTEMDLVGVSMRTYSHSVIAGDTVLVPGFGDASHPISAIQDLVVKGQFETIFPDYNVELLEWGQAQAQGPYYCSKPIP